MGAPDVPPELPPCNEVYPYRLVQLPEGRGLYERSTPDTAWGVPALVKAIEDAAFRMALEYPDADPVYVGDLSLEQGGPMPPHITHSDGRSADIGLYGYEGQQPMLGMFNLVRPEWLDIEKTWTLLESFLGTGQVEHILLDQSLIDTIHRWVVAHGRMDEEEAAQIFPPPGTARLWAMKGVIRTAPSHTDHFHVRFRCK